MHDNLQRLGPPPFDDADRAFAAKIQASDEDIEAAYRRVGLSAQPGVPLCDRIVRLDAKGEPMMGSTDVGDTGLVHVAKVMAGTAADVIQDEILLARARSDHQSRICRNPYVCPLPEDLEPPIKMSA
jgi:aminobenzoyl-glutamate utilization protein B